MHDDIAKEFFAWDCLYARVRDLVKIGLGNQSWFPVSVTQWTRPELDHAIEQVRRRARYLYMLR